MSSMLGDREDKTESCSLGERVKRKIMYSASYRNLVENVEKKRMPHGRTDLQITALQRGFSIR